MLHTLRYYNVYVEISEKVHHRGLSLEGHGSPDMILRRHIRRHNQFVNNLSNRLSQKVP